MATVTTMIRKSALPVDGIEPYIQVEGEEYMNEQQKHHFRDILSAWKQVLIEGVNRTVDHMKQDAAHYADPADRATQEEEFALELRNRDRERKLVRKIDKTLNFLESEDFGYCEACGIEIGLQRLEVRPTAELCVDCKTTQEIKERQLA
jgi:DnaK suppressor protein